MEIPNSHVGHAPILSAGAMGVLAGLNRDYLDLLIAGGCDGAGLLGDGVMRELSAASPEVLDSMAACCYALFALDLPFPVRTADPAAAQVNDPVTQRYCAFPVGAGTWTAFTTTALFFAWHLSRNSPLSARVMLGLPVIAAHAIAALDPWELQHIAGQQPAPLKPRWHSNPCFWPDLVRFAASRNPLQLDLARLLGLQLLAADLQSSPGTAARRRGT